MKFLYKSMYSALLMGAMGLNATAQQQLPSVGFEGEWVNCVPWTSLDNTTVQDTEPEGWCVSNVIGMGGLGATTVRSKVEGYNSETAVKLTNTANQYMKSQIIPAYLNLGTSWSTAVPKFGWTEITVTNSDGGSFKGLEFTDRPKSLEFMYQRSRGTAKPNEKTTIVAYLWKGHWTQADVPGNIIMGTPTTVTMTDRDRCVLGMSMDGCQGGNVTSEDGLLIGKIEAYITENTDEWTKFSADFEYFSEETPEYINVIISAGDYFGGADAVGEGNSLVVDDVRLVYDNEEVKSETYAGYLNIYCKDLNPDDPEGTLAKNSAATIEIIPTGENTCTFKLPNFALGDGDGAMQLGDIVVENVTVTEKDGVKTFSGVTKDLKLMSDMILADVTIKGTITGDVADMTIDVIWTNSPLNEEGTPIYVTFTTNPVTSGITDITVDNSNAPVEFYNLQGVRVNADNLTPGIYVRRQGSQVSKVLVK